jgi:hypothetical protein
MKIIFDSEAELEEFIHQNFLDEGVCCIDDTAPDHLLRQVNLGQYGIADLVAFTFEEFPNGFKGVVVTVYELKKEKITADAFAQAARYATAIKALIDERGDYMLTEIKCALVGTEIDESCFILNLSNFHFYKAHFNPACGVDFKDLSEGWNKGSSASPVLDGLFPVAPAAEINE